MELKGKKINFLGDSITEGAGVSSADKIYLNILKEKAGLSEARNYGIGGTRFAKQTKPSAESRYDLDFNSRFGDMDDDADVIAVFGGTNDFGHGDAPLGEMSDRTPWSFYGACHCLMSGLINKYPAAEIVFLTPLHRLDDENLRGEGNKEKEVAPLEEYVRIIKQVAGYYSLPVLDLFSCGKIQPNIPVLREKYCPDGVHPNDAGNEIIANRLWGFLKEL